MTLAPGQKLAHYEIVEPLGRGGMGEVYRARDAKLARDVAIKVLPEELAGDKDRLARFEREARLLAQLSHTNVATLFGIEDAGGTVFLAMELVEGETLAQRIARGPIPLEEALLIFVQIAEGLDAAHERNIVHRDLKPANVKLTPSDEVKILDFGLAKAFAEDTGSDVDSSRSPTITRNATRDGVILGTAAYMSPEQAKGKNVDRRTDIWSFGVVLYEALTGARLFDGETVSDVLAAVLTREVDFDAVPSSVRPLLKRCLDRDPRKRLRDIGEARIALEKAPDEEPPVGRSTAVAALPWAVAVLAAVSSLLLWLSPASERPTIPVRRFTIDLPWNTTPNWTDFAAQISPDGSLVAYQGRIDNDVDIYVRSLDSLDARSLTDARELGPYDMTFSADSEWVLFSDENALWRVSIHGGERQLVAELDRRPVGLSWGPADDILVGTTEGLYRLLSGGTELTAVTRDEDEQGHLFPHHLPSGHAALVTVGDAQQDSRIAVVDLETGAHRLLPVSGEAAVYSPSGHIMYRRNAYGDSTVFAAVFDLDTLTVGSEPVPVLEGVMYGPELAADGTALYIPERGESNARLVWVDRRGFPTPIDIQRLDYSHLDLSSTGDAALLNINNDVYVVDLERGTRRLLGSEGLFPIFDPDGVRATFLRIPGDIYEQPADGSSEGEPLLAMGELGRGTLVPTSRNPATHDLALFDGASDVWVLSPDGKTTPFLDAPYNERSARFSPDGRWVAYVSDETGDYQVYVVPYPGPGAKSAVSTDGGLSPIWSRDGRELFFRNGSKLLAASVTYDSGIRFGQPVELFDGPYNPDFMGHQRYDVSPDGERFLMVENSDDFRVVIVQNWIAELARVADPAR